MTSLSHKDNAKVVRVVSPVQQADDYRIEDLFLPLRRAFGEMLEKRSTNQRFEHLYEAAYAMAVRNQGERLYRGLREAVTEHLTNKPLDSIRGQSTRKIPRCPFKPSRPNATPYGEQHYITTEDAFEYVAQVEQQFNEESEWANQCLDDSTVVPVVQVVQKEVIGNHMKVIVDIEGSGVEHMLTNRMSEDLARLFRFSKCVQGGVRILLDCISKHL
ncbi:hypothetical protein MTO96_021982 [Rhipicephalus appendiculatus]